MSCACMYKKNIVSLPSTIAVYQLKYIQSVRASLNINMQSLETDYHKRMAGHKRRRPKTPTCRTYRP